MMKRLIGTLIFLIGLTWGFPAKANTFTSKAITVTTTTTSNLGLSTGAGTGMVLVVDVSAIGSGDTWTFKAQQILPSGTAVDLTSTSANVTATGATTLSIASPYTYATATPFPTQVVATRSVAGGAPTVTYRVIGVFNSTGGMGAAQRYLVYDADTACWTHTGASGLEEQFCTTYRVEPTCPADPATLPFGAWCKDFTTTPPTLRYRGPLKEIQ